MTEIRYNKNDKSHTFINLEPIIQGSEESYELKLSIGTYIGSNFTIDTSYRDNPDLTIGGIYTRPNGKKSWYIPFIKNTDGTFSSVLSGWLLRESGSLLFDMQVKNTISNVVTPFTRASLVVESGTSLDGEDWYFTEADYDSIIINMSLLQDRILVLENEQDDYLKRDGTLPMQGNIDMNSNDIKNVGHIEADVVEGNDGIFGDLSKGGKEVATIEYVDIKDTDTLQQAKDFTYSKTDIDNKDANTLQEAKNYTYSQVDIDNKDTAIMNKANNLENEFETFKIANTNKINAVENGLLIQIDEMEFVVDITLVGNDIKVEHRDGDITYIPINEAVESGYYDTNTEELVLELGSGNDIRIPAGDIVAGLSSTDYVDTGLELKENKSNKITELVGVPNNTQYMSAKLTNDLIGEARTENNSILGGKLDKVESTTSTPLIYTKASNGTQAMIPYVVSGAPNTMAYRGADGTVKVANPTAPADAVNLQTYQIGIDSVDKLFFATFGTTTFVEITQALADGKLPIAISGDFYYTFVNTPAGPPSYYFQNVWLGTLKHVYVNDSDVWGVRDLSLELQSNKVQTISDSSTTTQFPSAKAVWDLVDTTVGNIDAILDSILGV